MTRPGERFAFEDFVEATSHAVSLDRLFELLLIAMAAFGHDMVNFSVMQDWDLADEYLGFGIFTNYPQIWLDEYTTKALWKFDPVAKCALSTFGAFQWRDLNRRLGLTDRQSSVLKRADRAGLHHGVGLPFMGPALQIGGIALASSHPGAMPTADLGLLMAYANQFYKEYKRIVGVQRPEGVRLVALTEMQQEVLIRIANGMTNRDIARALGKAPRTIDQHVRDAFERLEANSRSEAVAIALNNGLIETKTRVFTR